MRRALFVAFALGLAACDKEPTKAEQMAKSASTPPPTAPASETKPATPQKPQLAVDDTAAFVSGERIDLNAPDPKGRFTTVLGNAKSAGEDLTLEAARDTKFPKAALVIAGIGKVNAKSLVVRTPKRDRTQAEIPIALKPQVEPCAAVAWISKDVSTSIQSAAGTGGARFTKGMAGPDLTRASEGIKKLAGNCASPVIYVAADESVTWGLVVDLILSVTDEEGGASKIKEAYVLPRLPAINKKLELE